MSRCVQTFDWYCIYVPFQAPGDVHAEEAEAFDLLDCSPVYVDGGGLSLRSPVDHNQLLRLVDVEERGYFPGTTPAGPSPLPCRLSHRCWYSGLPLWCHQKT